MQRYESYKPSGLHWLGDIPFHWSLKKSKYLWREKEDRSLLGDEVLLSVSQYSGVVPRAEDSRSESFEDYKRCEPNDLVINIMLAWMSGLGVSKYSGIVSPAYCVYRQLEDHNPSYFDYLYRSPQYLAEFARRSKGIVPSRWRMYTEDFGQILSLLPPRDEQDHIVAFLDEKTAEIDAAIAKKERLIDLLEENLSIHISRAVTQGLNLTAPLKSSGAPWLGSIPSHWRPMKLVWVCSSIRDGTHNPPPETESEYRLLSVRNIVAGKFVMRDDDRTMSLPAFKALTRSYTVQKGDVVLALVGGTTGKSAVVDMDCENISVQRSLGILRPVRSKVLPEFLNFSLKAKGLQCRIWDIATKYAAQPGIYLEDVGNLKIGVPEISEQELIVQYCNDAQDKTFTTIASVMREIKSLREMKQSLISDVVSGKMKI